eukprot:Awhi_evm1s14034
MRRPPTDSMKWFTINNILILSTSASGVFLAGGYYFSMQQKYERLIEKLQLQLERERLTREMHDDRMLERLNHERDQQSLALSHLRRSYEGAINDLQINMNKQLFDIAFHGDYEKFRDDVAKGIKDSVTSTDDNWTGDCDSVVGFSGLISRTVAHEVRRELDRKLKDKEEKINMYSRGNDDPSGHVLLNVKNFFGTRLCELYVTNSLSVSDLKYIIEDETMIPPENQHIFFKGKKLQEGPSLQDYNVTDGAVVHIRHTSDKNFSSSPSSRSVLSEFKRETVAARRQGRVQYKMMPQTVRNFIIQNPDAISTRVTEAFEELDRNEDGVLSKEELKAFLYREMKNVTARDVNKVIKMMDTDKS